MKLHHATNQLVSPGTCFRMIPYLMTNTLIGYARCFTDKQDLAAQQSALVSLGVADDRIYMDRGLTGTNRLRPGLD